VLSSRNNWIIIPGLLLAVFLWGGNNVGVRFLVQSWPPVLVGSTRFLCAGMLMFALLRRTRWLGRNEVLAPDMKRRLWWRGGLSLAAYVAAFNLALRFTSASHVALYLAASPVWALMWEGKKGFTRSELLKRYSAAALALFGVVVLFLPVLKTADVRTLPGELLGLTASLLWTNYGRQCRSLGVTLSGALISAHTMWRAGVLLLPFALIELSGHPVHWWEPKNFLVQLYCIVGGGVLAFALWNNGLRHWKTSEVYLFNNLIPLSTMLWAHFCLGETVTRTFCFSMALIVSGVVIGQAKWQQIFGRLWLPAD
jgi:drug/metabolite transporter (DMT)-like permease